MGGRSNAGARNKDRHRAGAAGAGPQISAGDAMRILVTNALAALAEPNEEAFAERVELLAQAYDSPGQAVVEAVLAERVHGEIKAAWERGWQPVDIVRTLHRRNAAPQVPLAIDWMASELRGYPPATVDHRFSSQIGDLLAQAGLSQDSSAGDAPSVAAWVTRLGTDATEVIATLLRLIDVLNMLPPLPLLCPPPGRARPLGRRSCARPEGADPKVLERVRCLLAKAEASEFEAEAIAFTAKAQELIVRHSIDRALLTVSRGIEPPGGADHLGGAGYPDAARVRDGAEQPAGIRIGVSQPYEAGKAGLLQTVAEANGCQSIWSQKLGFVTVLGFQADLEAVELLYTSLLVQASQAMAGKGPRPAATVSGSRTRSYRQSFLSAFAVRIGDRLRGVTEQGRREGGSRLLPVLAGREQAVRALAKRLFPDVTYRPSHRGLDAEGWESGTRAADLARVDAIAWPAEAPVSPAIGPDASPASRQSAQALVF